MRNNNAGVMVAIFVACVCFADCASTRAPSGWLADPEDLPGDPFGGWITVEAADGRFSGELIAVTDDTLFVADSCLRAVPVSLIHTARLAAYNPRVWEITVASTLGTLSTVSNGLLLVFTAPLWMIGGTIAGVSRSRQPLLDYPDNPIMLFAAYARFPQGLPPRLERNAIQMKPQQ